MFCAPPPPALDDGDDDDADWVARGLKWSSGDWSLVASTRCAGCRRCCRRGGERPRRRLPDAEAATEEAAAAVIMTCFVVGLWSYVLCFWVAMHAVCVLKPGAPAEIT